MSIEELADKITVAVEMGPQGEELIVAGDYKFRALDNETPEGLRKWASEFEALARFLESPARAALRARAERRRELAKEFGASLNGIHNVDMLNRIIDLETQLNAKDAA